MRHHITYALKIHKVRRTVDCKDCLTLYFSCL
nr:MAG TPA: hypothetical protein [Caudoviricetes sp.]